MPLKKTLLFPSYFPTIASFSAILQYEVNWEIFGNYQKQSLRNRANITNDRGLHSLSVPVIGKGNGKDRLPFIEVLIDNSQPWQRTHWRTLQTAYRTSPFFEFYEHALEPLFTKTYTHLLSFNMLTTQTLCECLQVTFPEGLTSVYEKKPLNCKDHRELISPKPPVSFKLKAYNQVFIEKHGFIAHLSVLDLLFNEGPQAANLLKQAKI